MTRDRPRGATQVTYPCGLRTLDTKDLNLNTTRDTPFFKFWGFNLRLLVLTCGLGKSIIWLTCTPLYKDKLKEIVESKHLTLGSPLFPNCEVKLSGGRCFTNEVSGTSLPDVGQSGMPESEEVRRGQGVPG